MTTDASNTTIGAVLSQEIPDGLKPVAFESHKLNPAEQNYATHEKELLTIVHTLKTWRPYLLGQYFKVITDYAALKHIQTQKNLTPHQSRWLKVLQSYNPEYYYKLGKMNIVADALSRIPAQEANTLTTIELPDVLQEIQDNYEGSWT